ncbi:MAG: hypothetical protein ACJ75D_10405, partial [Gaiellaceae bacterium]
IAPGANVVTHEMDVKVTSLQAGSVVAVINAPNDGQPVFLRCANSHVSDGAAYVEGMMLVTKVGSLVAST